MSANHGDHSLDRLPMGAPDFQERDIPYKMIGRSVVGLLIFVLVCMGAMRLMYYAPGHRPDGDALISRSMNQPPLQARPRENLAEMRAEEKKILESYGWVDRTGGVVHLPIERAIDVYLEKRTSKATGNAQEKRPKK